MHYRTRKKIKDTAAVGSLAVPAAALIRMAGGSDRAFRRAGKTAAVVATVGGLIGGGLGFASYKDKYRYASDDEALESTVFIGLLGSVIAGVGGGLASLSRSALNR